MVGTTGKALMVSLLVTFISVVGGHSQMNTPQTGPFAGPVRLVLPRVIYASPGIEVNVYFDNIILATNWRNYEFSVVCDKGMLLRDRWTFTPSAKDQGDFPLMIEVYDQTNRIVGRAVTTLEISAETAGTQSVTLLAVGDSLTQAGVYPQHLLELAGERNAPQLKLIGSRGPENRPAVGANRFEGYNGWTAQAFATLTGPATRSGYFKPGETGSPFLFEEGGRQVLDFASYCKLFNDSKAPDFVTFALGTNDVFAANDTTIDATIDKIFVYYDSLVEMVHHLSSSTRVGLVLIIPPSDNQDGFRGYHPPERQTRWQYRRNQHRFIERMIAHYGSREKENLFLVPAYASFDAAHNFVTRPLQWNAENPQETERVIDGIHPALAGYRQMADSIFAWMQCALSENKQ